MSARLASRLAFALALACAACGRIDYEQGPRARSLAEGRELHGIERELFTVEQLVQHQDALGLSDVQRSAIDAELQGAQSEMLLTSRSLREARDLLAEALRPAHVEEAEALARAARVSELEGRLKLAHLRLLVRVKNQLTPAQQTLLRARLIASDAGTEPAPRPR